MATAKKEAAKKSAKKKTAGTTPAAKKTAPRKAAAKAPGLGRTVNMGPERGDNSWPPSNKALPTVSSRAPGTKQKGSPAKDSTSGPGGKALQGRGKDAKRA
jgi:hypothetical protein